MVDWGGLAEVGTTWNPLRRGPRNPEGIAQIDVTNLFPKARDHGVEALVGLLRQGEDRLVGLLRPDRLPDAGASDGWAVRNYLKGGIRAQNVPAGQAPRQQVVRQPLRRADGQVQGVLN